MKLAFTSAALLGLVLALPASAQSTNSQPRPGETTIEKTPSSGPGVKGPPDTRTGPATRTPGQSSGSTSSGGQGSGSGSSGASGHDPSQPMTSGGSAGVTQPSQDAKGVQGAPGNKNGPAVKAPGQGGNGSAR